MTELEVYSADFWESRFEGDWAQTQDGGQSSYFASILQHHLPPWLVDEIQAYRLSILDWGCAGGEVVDSLRTQFPRSHVAGIDASPRAIQQARLKFGAHSFFGRDALSALAPVTLDVLVTSNVLQYFHAPWMVLRKLGVHVARHLVVLVPFRGESLPGSLYTFDDANIGTLIDPDFVLSSCQVIGSSAGLPACPERPGGSSQPESQILLIYSRRPYVPPAGAMFGGSEPAPAPRISQTPPETPRESSQTTAGLPPEAAPAGEVSHPNPGPDPTSEPDPNPEPAPNPIESIILPALRRAQSIAVVVSAIPFSASLNQRPMCCAKSLADRGTTVLFVEVWECPEEPVHPAGQEVYPGVFSIPFYAFRSDIRHTFQENLDGIASVPHAQKSYLCTLPTRELVETARVLRAAGFHIHYDIMDDWESFFEGDQEMTHWFSASVEMEIVAFADTVTAVSPKLVEKFRRLRTDIVEVRNGYQPSSLGCEQFAAARAPLELPKVVGYFGHFSDAWFDWEALFHAAHKHPDLEFELIGYSISDRSLLRVNGFPNIRFVGLVPQKDLRRYVARWWAAMIPFQASALSAAVDPLKVYEYLHFGLPVVVTGIPAVVGYPLVQLAGDPESFVSALEHLPDKPDEQSLSEVAEFLKSCVWDERLAPLASLLRQPGVDAELAVREATLRYDLRYWQVKTAELGRQLEWQRRREAEQQQQHLREIEQQKLERRWEVDRKQERIWEVEAELQRMWDGGAALQAEVDNWQAKAAAAAQQLDERVRIETDLRIRQQHLLDDLETREVEWMARASALSSHVQYWQAKSAELGKDLDEQRQRLQEAVGRFRAMEEHSSSELRMLTSRADASAYEAANLRRLTTDLLRSRSWKITAPLRFLSKPLFTAPAGAPAIQAASLQPAAVPASGASLAAPPADSAQAPDPLESLWAELRRASSIAVIPCAVPFRSTFGQRPISLAKYLADRGTTVLYVAWQWSPGEEPPADGQELYPRLFHLSLATFQSHLERIVSATLRPHERNQAPIYLCSLPTPALVEAVRPLRAGGYHVHYDIMDDWEEFHRAGEAPWYSASVEREMVMLSDTVSVVSARLAEKFARLRSDIVEVRNGYDAAALGCRQFVAARAPLDRPKVVGYFGHLSDAWFDWESVLEAARKLPDVAFELIGYGLSDRSRARLGDFPNVRFHGLVSQNDLHRYAKRWWVGIIPFRSSTLSAAVDPLKIYEYLHLGLPTVVTGVSGIADYPLVHFAKDRDSFLTAIDQVQERPGEQSLQEAADFLKECTWEARLAKLHTLIGQPAGIASLYAR